MLCRIDHPYFPQRSLAPADKRPGQAFGVSGQAGRGALSYLLKARNYRQRGASASGSGVVKAMVRHPQGNERGGNRLSGQAIM